MRCSRPRRCAPAPSADAKSLQARRAGPVTADAIAASLPDESTALLEFIVGDQDGPATLFVVQRPGSQVYRLEPPKALSTQVARFAALLESGTDAGELASTLGEALLQPALAGLGPNVTRLVIVPDGPLHRLPWDALRLADGRHVVQHYSVSLAPSAAVVSALWRRPREAGTPVRPMRLLAFGDPTFAVPARSRARSWRRTTTQRSSDPLSKQPVDSRVFRPALARLSSSQVTPRRPRSGCARRRARPI